MFKPLVKPLEKFPLPLEGLEKLLKALVLFNPIIYHLLPLLLMQRFQFLDLYKFIFDLN